MHDKREAGTCFVKDICLVVRHALDLNFKCVSKKVNEVKLGITLESQFVKEGGALYVKKKCLTCL